MIKDSIDLFAQQIYALAINLPNKTKHICTKHAASHLFHPTFPKITSSFPTSFNKYIVIYKYSRIHYCKILDHNNYIADQTLLWKKKRKRWSNKKKSLNMKDIYITHVIVNGSWQTQLCMAMAPKSSKEYKINANHSPRKK